MKKALCPICKEVKLCNRHHKFPRAVWGYGEENNKIIYLCLDCHRMIHEKIKEKENGILQLFPEIYIETLADAIRNGGKNGKRRK